MTEVRQPGLDAGASRAGASYHAGRIDGRDRKAFAPLIEAMHRDRKTVFIDQLKWDIATTADGLEIDEYDRDDTVYLLVADRATGGHLGSVRLLSTAGPHLLGDKFAGLCAGAVPRGPAIFEITRMLTRPGLPRDVALRVRQHLSIAIAEFALANGIGQFTMMTHVQYLANVLAVGWDCEPLGMPQEHDGVAIAALLVGIDAAALARMRAQYSIFAPVLGGEPRSALAA